MEKQDKDYVVYTISLQGKVMYVGSTNNFDRRKRQHLSKEKNHSSIPTDIDPSTVTIEIVRHWKSEKAMLNSEERLIKKYDTINCGWNRKRSGLITNDKHAYWKEYNATRKDKLRIYQLRWLEKHKKNLKKIDLF